MEKPLQLSGNRRKPKHIPTPSAYPCVREEALWLSESSLEPSLSGEALILVISC